MDTEKMLDKVSTGSTPSQLRITDMRFADLAGAPMHCTLVKIYTNQGIVGIGEVRDYGSRTYAAMLKGRILGENPCDVRRLFGRIRQFGGPARQGGGVSGIEIALLDLVGKAYGVPAYQLLGGRFRQGARVYCDVGRWPEKPADGAAIGRRLRQNLQAGGYTMAKAAFSVEDVQRLYPDEKILSGPAGIVENLQQAVDEFMSYCEHNRSAAPDADFGRRNRAMELFNTEGPYKMTRVTEHGLDRYEAEIAAMRDALGWEIPLALDHPGHLGLEDCAKVARRLERFNLAWLEDPLPCYYTEEYRRLSGMTTVPLATGEDLYLREGFLPLCTQRAVALVHPDVCSCGGMMEAQRIGELAAQHNMGMILHMCETPVAALASAHVGVATEGFVAMEFNAPHLDWWDDMVKGPKKPLIQNGFLQPPERPGLGIDDLDDAVLEAHRLPDTPPLWAPTDEWDAEYCNDRLWS